MNEILIDIRLITACLIVLAIWIAMLSVFIIMNELDKKRMLELIRSLGEDRL